MALGGSSGVGAPVCFAPVGPRHGAGHYSVAASATLAPETRSTKQQTGGTEFDEPRDGQRGTQSTTTMRC